MSLGDWITRIFSPSSSRDPDGAPGAVVAGGPSGFAALEDAEAAEEAVEATDAPPDPAP
jgi:hypothetical protein